MPTRDELPEILREERDRLGTWWDVSQQLYYGRVKTTVLSRIANLEDDYFPKDKATQKLLGIYEPSRGKRKYDLSNAKAKASGWSSWNEYQIAVNQGKAAIPPKEI